VIRYILPVLWMTSCFYIMVGIAESKYVSFSSPGGGTSPTFFGRDRQVAESGVKSAVSDCILLSFVLCYHLVYCTQDFDYIGILFGTQLKIIIRQFFVRPDAVAT